MRIAVIGDVHGCLEELDELLSMVDPRPGDVIWFLGDLIHRGPDSVGVIRRARELQSHFPGSGSICGNHEESLLRNRERGARSADAIEGWERQLREADWMFLDALPLFRRLDELNALLVHGGLYPRWFEQHGALPDPGQHWRRAKGRQAERLRRVLRVRMLTSLGNLISLDEAATPPGVQHWSRWYDGREGFVFFGHDPQLDPSTPLRATHALGLDTGCCFGGRLTAAVIRREDTQTHRDAERTGTREVRGAAPHSKRRVRPRSVGQRIDREP
ncbi:MAG: metallophosphoesterase family protein [Polyangiaceae bacterium]